MDVMSVTRDSVRRSGVPPVSPEASPTWAVEVQSRIRRWWRLNYFRKTMQHNCHEDRNKFRWYELSKETILRQIYALAQESKLRVKFLQLMQQSLRHSLTRSLTDSLTDSLTHSLTHWLAHWLTHSYSHSYTHSITDSLTCWLTRTLTHSLADSLTHLHSIIYSVNHSLTHR
jgi:hypothetical protein